MYPKEHKYTGWVRYSAPIEDMEAVHVDAQPDMENCSNGIAPQPNTLAGGEQKMKEMCIRDRFKDRVHLYLFVWLRMYCSCSSSCTVFVRLKISRRCSCIYCVYCS